MNHRSCCRCLSLKSGCPFKTVGLENARSRFDLAAELFTAKQFHERRSRLPRFCVGVIFETLRANLISEPNKLHSEIAPFIDCIKEEIALTAAWKFGISVASMPLSVLMLIATQSAFFILTFLVGFIASIVYFFDVGRELRQISNPTRNERILGIVFGVPQALLGLTSVVIGISIFVWRLYNVFIERQPEYTSSFKSSAFALFLVIGGAAVLASSFRSGPND
jgi:multisubunit Na+/H+ antiporter MnhC subunit